MDLDKVFDRIDIVLTVVLTLASAIMFITAIVRDAPEYHLFFSGLFFLGSLVTLKISFNELSKPKPPE
ncbi:MAG: hypothetical protein LBM61_04455 [Prevotellaceae bacterium]|jgi:hypothetical protein|nr:hypothetical protein [Prevotellaceae bacterium]